MATGASPVRGKNGVSIPVIGPEDVGFQEFLDALNARIAERAYNVFIESGFVHGRHLQNWLQAESELVTRVSDVQESGDWMAIQAQLRDIPPSAIRILLRSDEAIICGEVDASPDGSVPAHATPSFIYQKVKWPSPVDPASASAFLKDGVVTLTAKYAPPAGLADRTLNSEERVGGRPN